MITAVYIESESELTEFLQTCRMRGIGGSEMSEIPYMFGKNGSGTILARKGFPLSFLRGSIEKAKNWTWFDTNRIEKVGTLEEFLKQGDDYYIVYIDSKESGMQLKNWFEGSERNRFSSCDFDKGIAVGISSNLNHGFLWSSLGYTWKERPESWRPHLPEDVKVKDISATELLELLEIKHSVSAGKLPTEELCVNELMLLL